ncbi:hypothetical protein DFH11DRAFT_1499723 [Phellopilus nigrolimitatus]|nr:hypothetical protein DFH11DRAFT_1499723 [Phellopilus nigrolimitatus]
MPIHFKLTRPGLETRRLSFPSEPSWLVLEAKITLLFNIPSEKVAVSYQDSDGDIVTLSTQEELLDYFANCHVPGELIKFTVLDTRHVHRPAREGASAFVDDVNEEAETGLPTMGPTMLYEVDDEGWQRLPRIPEIFGMRDQENQSENGEGHAFVEVIDTSGSEHSARQDALSSTGKGKGRVMLSRSHGSKSTSSASVVEEDVPAKPPVHVYDVSDVGSDSPHRNPQDGFGQPRFSAFGNAVNDPMDRYKSVYTTSPRGDNGNSLPRTPSRTRHVSPLDPPASIHSVQTTPRQIPAFDLDDPSLESIGNLPDIEDVPAFTTKPSFVGDVANLVDDLTRAFASHPELSEGLRNLVRNTVGGVYWETEHERVGSAAESVRRVAEETSERISRATGNMTARSEQDAVRRIAEALGGVFRVIGELSSLEVGTPPPSHYDASMRTGGPAPPPPPPPPPHHDLVAPDEWSRFGGPPAPPGLPPFENRVAQHHEPPFNPRFPQYRHHHDTHFHPDRSFAPPPLRPQNASGSPMPPHQRSLPRRLAQMAHQPGRDPAGRSAFVPHQDGDTSYDPFVNIATHADAHESKVQLEAAKALYKAEKERFRQEKEERRRIRRETAERRAEEGQARNDGTRREETIIARIPLPSPSKRSKRPYAEVYSVPPRPAYVMPRVPMTPPIPVSSFAPATPPRMSPTTSTYATAAMPIDSATTIPVQSGSAVPAPSAPLPWPLPPPISASRRAALSRMSDRILARLYEMGITASSQTDLMDILTIHANRNDANEEEVLANVIQALDIRGSPSPRPSGSRLAL